MDTLGGADVPTMTSAATAFLAGQPWCSYVVSTVPVFAIAGAIGVFRCSLIPRHPDADVMVWVVVGDVPSAYLVHEPGDSWQDALDGYVTEMQRWIDAVRGGQRPGDDIIPVDAPPTSENAELLASRLEFIRTKLLEVDPSSVENDVK
jgi:hypothetical protein